MFNCISAILDKKGVAGGSGAHEAMAAELMCLDKEDRDGDSDEEFGNERNGIYTVSPPASLPGPRVPHVLLTARPHHCTSHPCTYIDSASQAHIVVHDCYVRRRLGRKLKLLGVTGAATLADEVEISIIAPSRAGTHTFCPEGPSMSVSASKDNILLHALLQKQGYDIKLRSGRPGDASYGCEIVTPDGDVITLIFEDNMYCLPFPEQPEMGQELKKSQQVSAVEHQLFAVPMTLP
eukprot:2739033-Rhodomonas_salina.2